MHRLTKMETISTCLSMRDDIAIVGYSFRLPQDVNDDQSFWEVLENRRNLRTDWPASRGNPASFLANKLIKFPTKGGHFLNEDLGAFDAPFFSVTAQEAAAMDPMQRWTLEESYRAFEKAGIPVEKLRGSRTAVFSASMLEDNARLVAMDPENTERTAATGSSVACVIPNRVSWYFDLRGPSIHVNTACSGSLSAVDMACKVLWSGDASCALVTGCNLLLDPSIFQMLATQNFLSPDSLCYSFDERANGYARGEGTLALILKPVSAAIEDGDMIRAVIRSTGSNQDGHTPVLTQPSPQSQEELIRHVYKQAGLSFQETRYVEAHGTGTPVGDPIEMRAIGRVFRKSRTADEPLYVGSVKANIGHLEGASALASLVKSILILEKGIIPPNALFEKINPAIDVEFFKIKVPVQSIPWPSEGLRRISVNSFGFGGSNTHVVLDDALHYMQQRGLAGNHCTALFPGTLTGAASIPSMRAQFSHENGNHNDHESIDGASSVNRFMYTDGSTDLNGHGVVPLTNGHDKSLSLFTRHSKLLVWSAADQKAVERMLESYKLYSTDVGLGDPSKLDQLAFTLASRRSRMLWRAFAVLPDPNSSQGGKALLSVKPVRSSTRTGLAFVFTGQGAQYVGMGWDLLVYPIFAQTLRQIDEIYHSLGSGWSLFDELRHGKNIDKPEYSQPLTTAIQIALVELLESFGTVPKAVVGHSSGEIAAAYTTGALSLHSACKVAFFRGKLTSSGAISPGVMISINVAKAEVPQYLMRAGKGVAIRLSVACINSPFNCTLSGPEEDINVVKAQADQDGLFAQKLKTGVAYHSAAMNAIADEYLMLIGNIEGADRQTSKVKARIPMVSSVSGKAIRQNDLAIAQYWVNNLISPVQFTDAVQVLTQQSSTLKFGMGSITDLIEIGPHAALKRPINDTIQQVGNRKKEIRYLHILHRSHSAIKTTLELAGQLFCLGHTISLPAVNRQTANTNPPFLVDCPMYPFDRSRLYWTESRISRDFRLRGVVSGDTLGVRVSDWNPLEPRWRNFLSTESTPWIGDHKMTDTVVYPAAGMLIMAIEAVQQVVPSDQTVRGYLVKQANFLSPIIVPQVWEERTETQVRLRLVKGSQNDNTSLFDVAVFSYSRNTWTECCNANIMAEYGESSFGATVDEDLQAMHKSAILSCSRPLDSKALYNDAAEHGLQYGEMFQLLQDVCWDGKNSALARADMTKRRFETGSLVHPAVLDQAFQVLRVASGQQRAANVPVRLVDAWFASSGWQLPQNSSIQWLATSHTTAQGDHVTADGEQGSIYALATNGTTLCRIQQANMAAVSKSSEETDRRLLHSIEWKPQLSLLDSKQLSHLYPADTETDETAMLDNYRKLCSLLNTVAAQTVRDLNRAQVPENLRRHIEWLEFHVERLPLSQQEEAYRMSDMDIKALMDEIERVLPTWKLYTVCAQKLLEILSGQADPLEVIFKHDLADTFYAGLFENICADGRLAGILELISHENPAMRVLEIGAGTGGMTTQVLAALEERESRIGAPCFSEYSYTDISPMFLERAKSRWPGFQTEGRLNFKTLDIFQGIENQGFQPASYDLIIAASVLHATPYLETTIQNVRKALKPGGRLILLEAIKPEDVATNFMAGLVPGWWVARDKWRPHSPAVSEAVWDRCLSKNGFSGNDMIIRDYKSEDCHVVSIILSTAVEEAQNHAVPRVDASKLVLVVDKIPSDKQLRLAKSVRDSLDSQKEFEPRICSFSAEDLQRSLANPDDEIVVCLVEVGRPLLANLSEESFSALRQLIHSTHRLLWVTYSGAHTADSPEYSVIQGFMRSIRAEQPSSHLVSLNIEGEADGIACANAIVKAVKASFGSSSSQELEYVFKDGVFMTARVIEDVAGNKTIQTFLLPQLGHELWAKTGALRLSLDTEIPQHTTVFVHDNVHSTSLGPHDVEIQADTWSFMEGDLRNAIDRTKVDLFGGNCGGVVTRVGSECNNSFQIGDRVCVSHLDCMRKYPRSHATNFVKIPEKLSIEAATSILHPGILAYYALVDIARLGERDTVLIHSAASSVGQIAVQIAQKQKAHVYATATSSEEKIFLVEALGISVEDIFDGQNATFVADVVRATEGEGVDVVLNSLVGDDSLRGYSQCLALGGRFIEISHADIQATLNLPPEFVTRDITFSVVDPTRLRPKPLSRLLNTVMTLIGNDEIQILRPPPVFNASQLELIHKKILDNETMNQIVVTASPDDVVPQFVKERSTWEFDNSASYLVAGGLGGIGRAILQWMADRGAKHLIVPSRSGAVSKAAAEVVAQLTAQGVNVVAPQCDVSSETSLSHVLAECARTMPPIRGCINAAMVLQDSIFQENMTFAKWDLAMRSKVQTSWNLHRLLSERLDFFILLSSLAGVVGQMASSNYAGGCAFQDALARYRVSQGQSAVSIDIGWMRNIGIIAETGAYQRQRLAADDMRPIDGAELLALLSIHCRPDVPQRLPSECQVLFGLRTPADHLAQGRVPPALLDRPLLATFSYIAGSGVSADQDSLKQRAASPATLFRQSSDSTERIQIVLRALADKLAGAMSISSEDVEPIKPLSTYGVDSLMAVDLRNWIGKTFGATVAVFDIMGGVSIANIADLVVAKSTIKGS
ncbi:hypothetical protein PENCOP_c015G04031 [Penicillium coprophilum]|uniref:Uncharacterized protein n=1 Tax=Penicillium coprophilum TaxID=36646 RepID=A0A1V6U906_9EURO|nr:hypothetical protein PENCOP_c015G04031 [Penicillium coprophilum]